MRNKKINICIFIDQYITIRHLIHINVFSELSKKNNVDFIFPPDENIMSEFRSYLPLLLKIQEYIIPENLIIRSI